MILNGINGGEIMSKEDGWDDEVVKRIIIESLVMSMKISMMEYKSYLLGLYKN